MNVRYITYAALTVALLTVSAWLSFPVGGIPITLQTLVVCLAVGLLGWKCATCAVLAYLLLGAVGVPVFAGFTGGFAKFLTPTGGYLLGFVCIPLFIRVCQLIARRDSLKILLIGTVVGLVACYTLGTVWFVVLALHGGNAVGWFAVLSTCVFPYLLFDGMKIAVAIYSVKRLKKYVQLEK